MNNNDHSLKNSLRNFFSIEYVNLLKLNQPKRKYLKMKKSKERV